MGCWLLHLDKHSQNIEYYYIIMRNEYYLFSFGNRLFYRAVHIVVICILMFAGAMPVSAQIYSTAQGNRYETSYPSEYGGMQQSPYATQDAQLNYNAYQSTVYQPFASSPSMVSGRRNTGGAPSTDGNDPTNPNVPDNNNPEGGDIPDDWYNPADPEDNSNESPVGEAWIMLLFAAVAALVVFVRQRRAAKLQA